MKYKFILLFFLPLSILFIASKCADDSEDIVIEPESVQGKNSFSDRSVSGADISGKEGDQYAVYAPKLKDRFGEEVEPVVHKLPPVVKLNKYEKDSMYFDLIQKGQDEAEVQWRSKLKKEAKDVNEDGVIDTVYNNPDTVTIFVKFKVEEKNEPPVAPNDFLPTNNADDVSPTTSLSWNGSTDPNTDDVISYQVFLSTSSTLPKEPIVKDILTSRYRPSPSLLAGTTYYWKVVATDKAGATDTSAVVSFTTSGSAPSNIPPTVPTNLDPSDDSKNVPTDVTLGWSSSTDADGDAIKYHIYLGTSNSPSDANTIKDLTATSYKPSSPLSGGTKYYWQVTSDDGNGGTTASPVLSFTTTGVSVNRQPTPPSNLDPTDGSTDVSTDITLGWTKSTDPDLDNITYEVYLGTSATPNDAGTTANITTSTFKPSSPLSNSTTYYWKVTANDGKGGKAESAVISFTTADPPPANTPSKPVYIGPTNNSNSLFGVSLSWNASSAPDNKAVLYNVYWGKNNPPTTKVASNSNNRTFATQSSFEYNTTYYWQIEAVSSTGETTKGDVWKYETGDPPLNPPTNFKQTGQTTTSISLAWDAVSDAQFYYIDVSSGKSASFTPLSGFTNLEQASSSTSTTISGLSLAETYDVRIRVKTSKGTSLNSTPVRVSTTWSPVTNLTVSSITGKSFKLSFKDPNSHPSVNPNIIIDISEESDFSSFVTGYDNYDASSGSGSKDYNVSIDGLNPSTKYYIRVLPTSVGINKTTYTTIEATTTNAALDLPVLNDATAITDVGFTISWASVSGAATYDVDVATGPGFTSFTKQKTGVSTTSATFTGLSPYIVHYVRVKAKGSSGLSSDFSATKQVATHLATPVAKTATSVLSTGFTTSWDAVSNAEKYKVEVATANTFASASIVKTEADVTGTSKAITGLNANTTYYYRVQALRNDGTRSSPYSNIITQATSASGGLSAPTASAGSAITSTGFTTNWSSVTGAATYKVEVASDNSFSSIVKTETGATGTSKAITSLSSSTTYYYRVTAVASGGATSSASSVITVKTNLPPPTSPSVSSVSSSGFTVSWTAANGADEYKVEVATASTFASASIVKTEADVTSTSQAITGLSASTTYYVRVQASKTDGSEASDYTSTVTQATSAGGGLSAPTASAGSAITSTGFTTNWSSVTGAATYKVEVASDNSFSSIVKTETGVTGTSKAITSLSSSTTYYYRVTAVASGGATSSASSVITVKTNLPPPTSPSVSSVSSSGFTVSWTAANGADEYKVEVATASTFASASIVKTEAVTSGTSQAITGLSASTTYYVRVQASKTDGSEASDYTSTVTQATSAAPAFSISSTAFDDGDAIASGSTFENTYFETIANSFGPGNQCSGSNTTAPITWTNVPAGTQSFVVIMQDSFGSGNSWDHWVQYNVPTSVTSFPSTQGTFANNSWGNGEYGGPCPPPDNQTHTYTITVYAVSSASITPTSSSAAGVVAGMSGKILGQASLSFTAKRP